MSMLSIAIRVGRHPGLRASNHPPWVGQATVGRLMRLSQRPPLRFASSSAGSFFPATEGMVLLHNPRCSKSRATLQLLEGAMADLTVREYLKDPLTVPELDAVLERLEVPVPSFPLGGGAHLVSTGASLVAALGVRGCACRDPPSFFFN